MFFIVFAYIQPANSATIYNAQITSGFINTSGGISGLGIGTLSVSGAFSAEFTDTNVQFTDLSVSTSPDSTFVFPSYLGTFDGFSFSGEQNIWVVPNTYAGTFDGYNLTLSGLYSDPWTDGIQYSFTINAVASPVPVPAAVWLFGSGLIGLIGVARRKKS